MIDMASREVWFPSASTSRAALSDSSQPPDHPASTLPLVLPAFAGGRRSTGSNKRPCGFSALRSPCVRPTPPDCNSRFTPVRFAGHSPRSLFRAAFRYPSSKPYHDRAGSRSGDPATLLGFFCALRSIPCSRGSPHFCGSSPHAVTVPRIRATLRRSPADFYGPPITLKSDISRRADNPTGFWVIYRGQAEPLIAECLRIRSRDQTSQSCHGLFGVFSRACRVHFHSTRASLCGRCGIPLVIEHACTCTAVQARHQSPQPVAFRPGLPSARGL